MRTLPFIVALALAAQAVADDAPPPIKPVTTDALRLTGYAENDSRWLKPNNQHDRYYTNGLGFSLSLHGEFATSATQWMPFRNAFGGEHANRRAVGLAFGHHMYTPEDIEEENLIEDDRPYAGYLYGGVLFQRSNEHTLDHVQLDLGLIGPSTLAGDAQIWIHDLSGAKDPNGWDNQLADEPTVQLYLRKKWRTATHTINLNDVPPVEVQLIPQVEVAVGNVYRHVAAGALVRIGFNLPDDFGPGRLADIESFTEPAPGGKPKGGGYLFARIGGKAIEHNIFLDGNTRKDSHHVDRETLVGEIQLGIALQFRFGCGNLDLAYSQTFLTEEFEGQRGGHSFGAVTASWVLRF